MCIEERVQRLVEEKIQDRTDLFLVDIKMYADGRLIILIDGDNGVDIKDCVAISRHVGFHLEEENAIDQAYNLEVSSPGIDTPLSSLRQYNKNLNRMLSVSLKDQHRYEGKLVAINETGIKLVVNSKKKGQKAHLVEHDILFDQIAETKVLISFIKRNEQY
ncbi:MAG: ribosome assembly cofactor RimP [Sphingobacteriaceae bacterium]|jgi:ribosome maturation factor RimP|nr:MAG: ribosome assembly cofactor RimP [Pedobacter sp.]